MCSHATPCPVRYRAAFGDNGRHDMASTSDITLPLDASAICRSCGLCCDGTLNFFGTLRPDEVAEARRCGLDVCDTTRDPAFRIPCPQHRDRQCAVYDDPGRPQTCRGYYCWVLQRCLDGHLTARSVRIVIGLAMAMNAEVAARIGRKKATGLIRLAKAVVELKAGRVDYESGDQWRSFEAHLVDVPWAHDESEKVSAELIRNILRAGGFLRRHFVWPESARKQKLNALKEAAK